VSAVVALALVVATLPWALRRPVSPFARPTPASRGVSGRAAAEPARDAPRTSLRRAPRRPVRVGEADPALLLELVAVALAAGAPVPTALVAVGAVWPGHAGEALVRAARALEMGAPWDVAWTGAGAAPLAVARALEPAWTVGASPVPLLRTAADRLRSRRRAAIRAAAGRLGVQLVVPLGLCYLPAFVLVGLVPVVVSLASGLLG
jgi:Flp pilus assembly protein TadB